MKATPHKENKENLEVADSTETETAVEDTVALVAEEDSTAEVVAPAVEMQHKPVVARLGRHGPPLATAAPVLCRRLLCTTAEAVLTSSQPIPTRHQYTPYLWYTPIADSQ